VLVGSGFAHDVEAEVAAGFGPFVVLFGQHSSDEANEGVAVGEDADDVGAAADFFVEPFLGIVGPDLAPDLLGNAVKANSSARAASRCWATFGSLSVSASSTRSYWATTDSASGWSKMECSRVRTQGQDDFGADPVTWLDTRSTNAYSFVRKRPVTRQLADAE